MRPAAVEIQILATLMHDAPGFARGRIVSYGEAKVERNWMGIMMRAGIWKAGEGNG